MLRTRDRVCVASRACCPVPPAGAGAPQAPPRPGAPVVWSTSNPCTRRLGLPWVPASRELPPVNAGGEAVDRSGGSLMNRSVARCSPTPLVLGAEPQPIKGWTTSQAGKPTGHSLKRSNGGGHGVHPPLRTHAPIANAGLAPRRATGGKNLVSGVGGPSGASRRAQSPARPQGRR